MKINDLLKTIEHPVDRLVREVATLPSELQQSAVESFVHQEDPAIRAHSIEVASRLKHPRANQFCIDLLDDPIWYVRCHACEFAASSRLTEAVRLLLHMVQADNSEIVRAIAAFALGSVASEEHIPELLQIAEYVTGENHEGTPVRVLVLRAVAQIRSRNS